MSGNRKQSGLSKKINEVKSGISLLNTIKNIKNSNNSVHFERRNSKDNQTIISSFNNKGVKGKLFQANLENKTKISYISEKTDFNIKDDFEENRTNKLVDKIIMAYGDSEKISKIKKTEQKIGLESSTDYLCFKKVEVIEKNLNNLTLTSPKEEGEKFELVEKPYIENLRKENDE